MHEGMASRNKCHYVFNTVFWKSCKIFFAKPKEVDPVNLNVSMTNSFDSTQKY